ncbi:HDOD domain-containing protein [Thalassomonas actiniarum]|uniref:HDOD domain-containing protein n=1 Tax=Thalassomonas actiniarum TaxID=485447 RepID=A0AAE9YRB3_9GAMM|nr:HDOD domain-containing protein [Thalassomonas actiniarum]WDD98853.1 HDOD domain-containing protein [Thalassomonas actiniarum]
MRHTKELNLISVINQELESNSLELPTLPIVAKNVREALSYSPYISAWEIADIVSTDPAITIYLLKVANSPLYSSKNRKVSGIKQAISILGNARTVSLITTYSIKQIFSASSAAYNKFFDATLQHSLSVAALSRGMALFSQNLDPDKAMLAGLIHQVGKLPILKFLNNAKIHLSEVETNDLLEKAHPYIGQLILQNWEFPDELANVPAEYLHFDRNNCSEADYADVVTTAYLQECVNSSHPHGNIDWSKVPAFNKLGLSSEFSELMSDELIREINNAHTTFM